MHKKALIAMSGGVDSAVAAMLAQSDGFDCAGAYMKLYPGADGSETDARAAANHLRIPFHELDYSKRFTSQVIESFINTYREGRTPNPCIICNKLLKFGGFLEKALELGREVVVTGHYARVERGADGRFLLKKGADISKDQSYVLYTLSQEQLSRARFPLGNLLKRRVRELAAEAGFSNLSKRESQDICFIPDGDYAGFIFEYTGIAPEKGRFVDVHGNYLGEHNGVVCYTIGQRRGMGLAMPYPAYVLELRPGDNTVVVGRDELLYSSKLVANDINLIPFDRIEGPIRASVKIRYNHPGQPATVRQTDEDSLYIEFDEPQRAITKGQAAVIYDGDVVIGGGTIS